MRAETLVGLSRVADGFVSFRSCLQEVPSVPFLTLIFVTLIFFAATQDIAVDGWALTLLSQENLSYASTAQTIGLNSGYFLSFTVSSHLLLLLYPSLSEADLLFVGSTGLPRVQLRRVWVRLGRSSSSPFHASSLPCRFCTAATNTSAQLHSILHSSPLVDTCISGV